MRVAELSITNVGQAVLLSFVPAVPELRKPEEGLRALHLLSDHLGHHVTRVHVDRADRHNFLAVSRGQVAQQHGDEGVELRDLNHTEWPQLNTFRPFFLLGNEDCFMLRGFLSSVSIKRKNSSNRVIKIMKLYRFLD